MDPVVEETRFQPHHMIFYMNSNKVIHDLSSKNGVVFLIESESAKPIVHSKSIIMVILSRHHYVLRMMTLKIQMSMICVK